MNIKIYHISKTGKLDKSFIEDASPENMESFFDTFKHGLQTYAENKNLIVLTDPIIEKEYNPM
jgi:hypothetical protein